VPLIFTLIISTLISVIINVRTSLKIIKINKVDYNLINIILKNGFTLLKKENNQMIFDKKWWQSPFSNNVIITEEKNQYVIMGDKWLINKIEKYSLS